MKNKFIIMGVLLGLAMFVVSEGTMWTIHHHLNINNSVNMSQNLIVTSDINSTLGRVCDGSGNCLDEVGAGADRESNNFWVNTAGKIASNSSVNNGDVNISGTLIIYHNLSNYVRLDKNIPGISIIANDNSDYAHVNMSSFGSKTNVLFATMSGGTPAAPTVYTGELLAIGALVHNGTEATLASEISFYTDGTPNNLGSTGRIDFITKSATDSFATSRWIIAGNGFILPSTDSNYLIGNNSRKVKAVYANNFTGTALSLSSASNDANIDVGTDTDLDVNFITDEKVMKVWYPTVGTSNPSFTLGHSGSGSYMFFGSKHWLNNYDTDAYAQMLYFDQSAAVNGTFFIRNENNAGNSTTYPLQGSLILSSGTNSFLELRGDLGIFIKNRANNAWNAIYASNFNDMVAKDIEEELNLKTKKALDYGLVRVGDRLNITNMPKTVLNTVNTTFYNVDGKITYEQSTSVNVGEGTVLLMLQMEELKKRVETLEAEIKTKT